MFILVNGMPYFGKRMVDDLNEFDGNNRYLFLNTYTSKWHKFLFILLLPFCDAILSVNGVSQRSGSLDRVIKRKKRLYMQWHGTDVLLAKKRYEEGTIHRDYIDHAKHIFSAPWFIEELENIVEHGEYIPISYISQIGNEDKYENISILTYIPKGKEKFYGWDLIRQLALAKPDLTITVMGSTGDGLGTYKNVNFIGWVNSEQVNELMTTHSIFVRLTEHDGKSVSVSEALGKGAEVIWNYPLPGCHCIELNAVQLIQEVTLINQQIEKRGMTPNAENIEYAKEHLSRTKVMSHFANSFQRLING